MARRTSRRRVAALRALVRRKAETAGESEEREKRTAPPASLMSDVPGGGSCWGWPAMGMRTCTIRASQPPKFPSVAWGGGAGREVGAGNAYDFVM